MKFFGSPFALASPPYCLVRQELVTRPTPVAANRPASIVTRWEIAPVATRPVLRQEVSSAIENIHDEIIVAEAEITKLVQSPVGEVETGEANGSDNLVLREEQATAEAEDKLRQARRSASGSCQGAKQISRSKLNSSSSHGMRTRKSMARGALRDQQMVQSRTVEDEVGKVMAVGARIGVDFSEVEDEVLVEIARREEEDAARFEALNG
ncbi:hypothetical protein Q3G72_023682 [Acer saccharum]|nr:hypothetical protein Q3G72_023682 [Acer saccharum]